MGVECSCAKGDLSAGYAGKQYFAMCLLHATVVGTAELPFDSSLSCFLLLELSKTTVGTNVIKVTGGFAYAKVKIVLLFSALLAVMVVSENLSCCTMS